MPVNNHCDRWLAHGWLWFCICWLRVFLGNLYCLHSAATDHAWSRFLRRHGDLRARQPLFNVKLRFHTKNNVAGKKTKSIEIQTWRVILTFCLFVALKSSVILPPPRRFMEGFFCGAFVPFNAFNVLINVDVPLQTCYLRIHGVFNQHNIVKQGAWR